MDSISPGGLASRGLLHGGPGALDRAAFDRVFATEWLLGQKRIGQRLAPRWQRLNERMLDRARRGVEGTVVQVERRADLTPEEFRQRYFLTGIPVVLERAAANWPAVRKWTPDYLASFCGGDDVAAFDGHNWSVSREIGQDAVQTAEQTLDMRKLIECVKAGGPWYGAFLEVLDQYPQLRADLDLSFVESFGHIRKRLPWERNIIAKMYIGAAGTATSLHCAGVSNLYVQVHGRKKWVLIQPQFTPYLYPAPTRGINWQSRVDFRNPDYATCPLYRYVDRQETILEPGDVLWNPPMVWHGVANVTESIAVSLWWVNVVRAFSNATLLSALTLMSGRPNPIALQLGLSRGSHSKKTSFRVHLNK